MFFFKKPGIIPDMERKSLNLKKKILRGGVISATGLSILLAGLFHSPADLIRQQTIDQLQNRPVVEIMLEEEDQNPEDDSKRKMEAAPSRKSIFGRIADVLRSFFLALPWPVRLCICIPLWAAGYGIIHLVTWLLPAALSPVLHHILSWAILAAVLLGVFALALKCLFPRMPWKKIFCKRNLLLVLVISIILKAADLLVPLAWSGYTRVKYPVMLALGAALLCLVLLAIRKRRKQLAAMRRASQTNAIALKY